MQSNCVSQIREERENESLYTFTEIGVSVHFCSVFGPIVLPCCPDGLNFLFLGASSSDRRTHDAPNVRLYSAHPAVRSTAADVCRTHVYRGRSSADFDAVSSSRSDD